MKLNIYDYKVVTVKADDRSNVSGHEVLAVALLKFFNENLQIRFVPDGSIMEGNSKSIYIGFTDEKGYLLFSDEKLNESIEKEYGRKIDIVLVLFDLFNNKFHLEFIMDLILSGISNDYYDDEDGSTNPILLLEYVYSKGIDVEEGDYEDWKQRFLDYMDHAIYSLNLYHNKDNEYQEIFDLSKKYMNKDGFYFIFPSNDEFKSPVENSLLAFLKENNMIYRCTTDPFPFFGCQDVGDGLYRVTLYTDSMCRYIDIYSVKFSKDKLIFDIDGRGGYCPCSGTFIVKAKNELEIIEIAESIKKEMINLANDALYEIFSNEENKDLSEVDLSILGEYNLIRFCIENNYVPESNLLMYDEIIKTYRIKDPILEYISDPIFEKICIEIEKKAEEIKRKN